MKMKRQQQFTLRRLRRAGWVKLVVLFIVGFVALLPVAQAFCVIDLPVKGSPTPAAAADEQGHSHGEGQAPDPCCDHSPSAIAAADDRCDDLVSASGRVVDPPVALATSTLRLLFPVLAQESVLRESVPPPEARFRRLKRLLI
jgi:hypothetical protein